ncbi:comF family protein [Reichenbachiella agariperforans]|uniref:ComF family protein n=1 Tax=Reichenbachiella agariperforans TaxID=156994 RepID=A0A1M6P5H8_REIAG|nr:comF family protein [Reichenbachiella agariperforans]
MDFTKYWRAFVTLVFPITCADCNRPLVEGEEFLCLHCRMDLPLTNYHLINPNPLETALSGYITISRAHAYLKYNKKGTAQKLLHQLKYGGSKKVGLILGKWMARDLKSDLEASQIDYIVPVPLYRTRSRKRGYNQSMEIARGLSETLAIPIASEVIKRIRMYKSQAQKSRLDRLNSDQSEYKVIDKAMIEGKHILLVDDVITTGATIGAVSRELLLVGEVAKLSIACLATGK